ncbi:MAG: ABC transporter substrate-binding protein [Deltaproteobacteria bacterium]|nr:ABC transporter substrate-binding protein [Deltaproteobacteria bacterium]
MKRLLVAVLFLSAFAAEHAWPQPRTKLNIVYPAISGINAALWFAAETRAFEKHGLEVKLIYIPTALQVTRVVLTGDSQIAFSGGTPVVNAVLGGADLVFIGGVANVPAFYMMALPEIKSVADLKGKAVGVTRFGSSTDFAMRYLLLKQGLNPDKDVTVLQLGGMPELAAALSKRLIAAAPLSAPTHIRARSAGAQPLIDLAKAGVYFPHTAVITTRGYLKTNREIVVSFFKGYSEGIQRFLQDKATAKKIIQQYTRDSADDIIEATYQYSVDYIVRPPFANREGIVETLKLSTVPEASKANPDHFIDNSVVKGLEEQGFFRQIGMTR